MDQSELYSRIESALQEYGKITKADRDFIIDLAKDHYTKGRLTTKGPCLQCDVAIEYGIATGHHNHGDKFLKKLHARWDKTAPIAQDRYNEWKFGGYEKRAVWGYLCENCQSYFDRLIHEADAKRREENEHLIRQFRENRAAVIRGEVKVSTPKRYKVLAADITTEEVEKLKTMPYSEFLETYYWEIIRKYKLWDANYKCQLCNTNGQLEVHHKTYEHHGEEHYYLEDLIVLCRPCHAKFHDKLDEPQTA